jgi:hypothetical protein
VASIYRRGGKENLHGRYRISYFDQHGTRRDVTAGSSDYDSAVRIAAKLESEVAERKYGITTPEQDRMAVLNGETVRQHVDAYISYCLHIGHSAVHVSNKKSQLGKLLASTGAKVFSDLTELVVERHLATLEKEHKSARTVDQHRNTTAAFMKWCYSKAGIRTSPLSRLSRGRVRRAEAKQAILHRANLLVRMVQGEMALEGQGLSPAAIARLRERAYDLLVGLYWLPEKDIGRDKNLKRTPSSASDSPSDA